MNLETKIRHLGTGILTTGAALTLALSLGLPLATWAAGATGLQAISSGVNSTAQGAGLSSGTPQSLESVAGLLINSVLSLVGIILLAYMIYGGFRWMTARGDAKLVTEAQATIKNAIIGIVIISLAFVLTSYILGALINAQGGATTGQPAGTQT